MNDDLITIDPPSGWKYGFPKSITLEEYNTITSFKDWCIDNGYPKRVAESYGKHFYVSVSGVLPKPIKKSNKLINLIKKLWEQF